MPARAVNVIISLIFYNQCAPTTSLLIQDLKGTWNVKNEEKGYNFPACVPGGIYTDLMRNNIIGDVFYGFNDTDTRWVAKTNWTYSRSFKIGQNLLAHDNINVVFDGIDTFSTILINNAVVGTSENMFVRYMFDVKPHLQLGNNTIEVQFKSAVQVAQLLFEKQAKHYVVPPLCVPDEYNGECHVNHIRKMQASFAWDWGPAFPSVGLWKNVYLEAYNSTRLRDVTVNISADADTNYWDIYFKIYLADNPKSTSIQGTLVIKLLTNIENITSISKINVIKNEQGEFVALQKLSIPQSYVHLWWPNGYGEAKLYPVQVSFTDSHKAEKSHKTFRIGFRTVELVQNIINSGRTFYFKINNVPIFAKGSNSIPINILPELGQNESTMRFLLQSAKDVNMNMLRVWGGGVYESDMFYEFADELGILIWQDFMFACSMYPTSDGFLKTVAEEVRHQVRRLQHHPSIVLWAANNENEVALRANWYGTKANFSLYHSDFKKLYVKTIKPEVLLNDNTRPFLTSSPTNGKKSEEEDFVSKNPQSHFYGDVHYYNYFLDSWKRSIYPVNRFASEYGYQSLPSADTLLTAINDTKDLMIDSRFLTSRQHHKFGYTELELLISYQLRLPDMSSSNFYKAFIFYSQIIQAMAIKIETEYYRHWRSNLNSAGEGLTMGTLYWQLNDVWVAPSWSSIDFQKNWKMLHYYAKHFFAPIIVTSDLTIDKNLNIYMISDLINPIQNAVVNVSIFRWDSFIPVHQITIKTQILPGVSNQIATYALNTLLTNITGEPCGKDALKNCFIYFTVKDSHEKTVAPDNYFFPIRLKMAVLQTPILNVTSITQTDNTAKNFELSIQTDAIALFVWLNARGIHGRFSDNGFLQVTKTKSLQFCTTKATTVPELHRSITVTNLLDIKYK